MMLSMEQLKGMHSGRVILRQGKKRLRIVKPSTLKTCEICQSENNSMMAKWESGGNVTILSLCFSCALEEIQFYEGEK